MKKAHCFALILAFLVSLGWFFAEAPAGAGGGVAQALPDTGQLLCYNIDPPQPGVEEQPDTTGFV